MQLSEAEDVSIEQVKAAMLISGANRQQYGKLKDELANDYLLGSDHYPDTLEKAARILANYQNTRASAPYRASGNKTGVVFLQRIGRGGRAQEEKYKRAAEQRPRGRPGQENPWGAAAMT